MVSQPVQIVEKIFQKSSESSLQSQESNKTNGFQFRLRITKNQHKQIKPPKLPFQQTEPNEPAGLVSQPVQIVEKIFKKSSESSLQSQESNKTNGVQFRLRITKNQHKQFKPPKLPFQQTEPNEPAGFVSQPVQMVEKIFQKSSEPSLHSQESNKTNGVQFQLRITKNQHKQIKPPKLPFQQTEPNEPASSISQPVQMVEKIFQKSSKPSLQSQESNKTNGVQFRLRITKNQHKQIKPPKLPFQQTEPNEPVGSVSQPVRTVEKIFEKFSESYLRSQESKKKTVIDSRLG